MQYELFEGKAGEDETWEVLEVRSRFINGRELVEYCHTRPKNWVEPEPTTKLPWE